MCCRLIKCLPREGIVRLSLILSHPLDRAHRGHHIILSLYFPTCICSSEQWCPEVGEYREHSVWRPEVYFSNSSEWETACDDSWGLFDATVACKQIGLWVSVSATVLDLALEHLLRTSCWIMSPAEGQSHGLLTAIMMVIQQTVATVKM